MIIHAARQVDMNTGAYRCNSVFFAASLDARRQYGEIKTMSRSRSDHMQVNQAQQMALRADAPVAENQEYFTRQLITYIGNKRSLLGQISRAVEQIKRRCGVDRLRCFDVFSGSGVVSRLLKGHSSYLVSNDLEEYAAIMSRCFLANRSQVDMKLLEQYARDFNASVMNADLPRGFIEEMYSPKDEESITEDDRVFYTQSNARRIDNYRRLIDTVPDNHRDFLLAPLLSEASIHANTAGVFKGFYKNRDTKIGQFGGSGSDALLRILGDITLTPPILSEFECDYEVLQMDANRAARQVANLDLAYLDPPYNQHPYGSNYFMLNLIARYERPEQVSRVSGIPTNWNRSGYNIRSESLKLMTDLVEHLDSRFLLISFNDEGFIPPDEMRTMLDRFGSVETFEMQYNAFRGSRSFENRSIHVTEHLFLVERR